MDRYELAWAAGFFDGEGWANAVAQEGRTTKQPRAQVNQADDDGIPAVLLRLQRSLGGLGRIGGPYVKEGRQDLYHWQVSSRTDVELLHHLLLPWLGQVKLDEFGRALGRPAAASRRLDHRDDWLAWAGGLWDGEGSVYLLEHRSHDGYRIGEARITQSSWSGPPEVLDRFLAIARAGKIYGPYEQTDGNAPVYRWNTSALHEVLAVIDLVLPRLSAVKIAQAREVAETLRAQPKLQRGRPDWGNHKTHCINGHEYATARVRPHRSRGKEQAPRENHHCLVCAREQARARRQKKKSAADAERRLLSESRLAYLLK